jgi:hypothetical protein
VPTPTSSKKASKRDSVSTATRDSLPSLASGPAHPSPTSSPVLAGTQSAGAGSKRKRSAQNSRPTFVPSGSGGAVVVRDRVVSVSDCADPDSVSTYELCRRWMQDDAHLRPRTPIVHAPFSLVDGASLADAAAPQRKALLAALVAERLRVDSCGSPARASKKRAANVTAAIADATSPKAPSTKTLLNEFVSRAKRERKQWQTRFDERVRLADDVLRHSRTSGAGADHGL